MRGSSTRQQLRKPQTFITFYVAFKIKIPQPPPISLGFFPGLSRMSAEGAAPLPLPRSPQVAAGDASPAPLPVGAAGAHRVEPGWAAEANGHQ